MAVGRILHSGGASLGVELSSRQGELLDRYVGLVLAWSRRLNLSGVSTEEEAARVLVLDALACLAPLPHRGTLVDLGSGAGTPGVPVAVARPDLHVTLVDASRKKAGFLAVVVRELGLENAEVLHARAEEVGRAPAHRERHDAVTARALASLSVLAEYALPLLRIGGVAVFPKARRAAAEVARAAGAVALLGGASGVEVRPLPSGGDLMIVRKAAPTPDRYPRRPGVPARRPLP
ncbi:MAG: 16S rRNA (guanine(527)-N(7))-methyltransferase RsmG [Bacillati bacterium ANGP1]|uniref:Ribosomal RNA small subunit methyltransferase G n=1 Tax=Candidatus Segetimicrobium genomatis TaxID=2569760 RepID=A0A537K389_9BACT|nr:MAG: 16S rRNA (guanine(527)-N(7))-methyltransferase RsmG [Terrabacteria group bacterium ANGP1]